MPGPTLYVQLADQIRREILTYRDGVEIPSLRSLARRHTAATNTVRRALDLLVSQHVISPAGPSRRYIRRRPAVHPVYCKPYPAVALLPWTNVRLVRENYIALLVGSLMSELQRREIMTSLLPSIRRVSCAVVPGGVCFEPGKARFSAIVALSGVSPGLLADWVGAGALVMTLDYVADVEGVDSVAVDCEAEAVTVVQHLRERGHRTIAFLHTWESDAPDHWTGGMDPDSQRLSQALLHCKQQAGLNPSPRYHVACRADRARSDAFVRAAVARLWRLEPRPTALVCFDPLLAAQAMMMLRQHGVACPSGVSIVTRGIPDEPASEFTTLVSKPERMGAAAAEHMFNRLTDPATTSKRILIESSLLVGSTTAPATPA